MKKRIPYNKFGSIRSIVEAWAKTQVEYIMLDIKRKAAQREYTEKELEILRDVVYDTLWSNTYDEEFEIAKKAYHRILDKFPYDPIGDYRIESGALWDPNYEEIDSESIDLGLEEKEDLFKKDAFTMLYRWQTYVQTSDYDRRVLISKNYKQYRFEIGYTMEVNFFDGGKCVNIHRFDLASYPELYGYVNSELLEIATEKVIPEYLKEHFEDVTIDTLDSQEEYVRYLIDHAKELGFLKEEEK